MSELDVLLDRYRTLLQLTWSPTLSGAERVWFVVYSPAQERRLRLRLADFELATCAAGHGWVWIDVSDAFADWMATHEYRDDYFREPEYVETVLPEFFEVLTRRLQAQLAAADANSVVAIFGLSALFGLASISDLVVAVRSAIRGRLLVFFPGKKEGSNYRFLDAKDGWNYLSIAITADEAASP
ncbi:MAG TPA: DUF1788 domain-containing protein [Chloroflexi bacterium]|nr:DUF1788 domain-containing protein [Chloroflexota bacterium]